MNTVVETRNEKRQRNPEEDLGHPDLVPQPHAERGGNVTSHVGIPHNCCWVLAGVLCKESPTDERGNATSESSGLCELVARTSAALSIMFACSRLRAVAGPVRSARLMRTTRLLRATPQRVSAMSNVPHAIPWSCLSTGLSLSLSLVCASIGSLAPIDIFVYALTQHTNVLLCAHNSVNENY